MAALLLLLIPTAILPADEKPAKEGSLKIQGRMKWYASARPGSPAQQLVINDVASLRKALPLRVKDIPDFVAKKMGVNKLDFDRHTIIVVTGGAQSSGGYSVTIQELIPKGDTVTVKWKLNRPKPGSPVTDAFSHPGEAVLVSKIKGKVVFEPKKPTTRK